MISDKSVKDVMSTALVTVEPDMTLPDARYLIKQYKIRRLPVVKNGALVGIVTLTDLLEAGPSDAIALNASEIDARLKRITLQQIMTLQPYTILPSATLSEAASVMLKNKIGSLPVVDEHGHLVGLLTESDIFKVLAKGCV